MIDEKIILAYLDRGIEKLERKLDRYGLNQCWRNEYADMATLCNSITVLEAIREKILKLTEEGSKGNARG